MSPVENFPFAFIMESSFFLSSLVFSIIAIDEREALPCASYKGGAEHVFVLPRFRRRRKGTGIWVSLVQARPEGNKTNMNAGEMTGKIGGHDPAEWRKAMHS